MTANKYKCLGVRLITAALEEKRVTCEATIEFSLPFPPFEGLEIVLESARFTLAHIAWLQSTEDFMCMANKIEVLSTAPAELEVPPNMALYQAVKRREKENGWKVSEDWELDITETSSES